MLKNHRKDHLIEWRKNGIDDELIETNLISKNNRWIGVNYCLVKEKPSYFMCIKYDEPFYADQMGWQQYKYQLEPPFTSDAGIFAPRIPLIIADQIVRKHGEFRIRKEWEKFKKRFIGKPDFAIWQFSKHHQLSIIITTGYLNTLSLISHGYLAIGLASPHHWAQPAPPSILERRNNLSDHEVLSSRVDCFYLSYLNLNNSLIGCKQCNGEFIDLYNELLRPDGLYSIPSRELILAFNKSSDEKIQKHLDFWEEKLMESLGGYNHNISSLKWHPNQGENIAKAIYNNNKVWLDTRYEYRRGYVKMQ